MRILYIDIDSLRPDRLGCYGYCRPTSPNIDRLARDGVILGGVHASDVPCLPSRTALFTGRHGSATGVVNHGGRCADLSPEGGGRGFRSTIAETTLASLLSKLGYRTVSISPFPRRHSAYQMAWGFHETYDTGLGGLENADEIYAPAADWLHRNADRDDWFLHVNFWDPHTPYDTPEWFGNPFEEVAPESWLSLDHLERQRSSYGPHSAREVPGYDSVLPKRWRWGRPEIGTLEDAQAHWDGYDTGVLYADRFIGMLIELLEAQGVLEETAIIVSADHGENLGELNVWGDHQTADSFTTRIPAIVRWPGVTDAFKGVRRDGLCYHLDLGAMIVDLAHDRGRELVESAGWSGESLRRVITCGEPGREALFLSQGAWSLQRSVRWQDWILIHTRHTGFKDFPEWMLFNLRDDPHETRNLAGARSDLVSQGRAMLERWFSEQTGRSPVGDPFDVVEAEGGPYHANVRSDEFAQYLARLRSTGRSEAAAWLEEHGGTPREPSDSIYG